MNGINLEPTTRASLLVRLHDARDDDAWRDFQSVYEPVIYAMTRKRGLQDADASEIVQEVLISVSRSIESFSSRDDGSFRGWLSRMTRNATIDRIRATTARRETICADGAAKQMEEVGAKLNRAAIREAEEEFERHRRRQLFRWAAAEVRRRTGEANWMAFWKSSVDGLPVADVARELGIDEGAVYVARCRIIKRIRELVDDRMAE